ncbi:hypothetical protein SAMN05216344_1193 [Polaromonas sp. OV174]|uniref:hypothetical protein n=1 Tax=Polaromonas sp. OV174 TaxID=1855300 RepID=UPI0008EDF07E|nr:hypothetical protein [Polaromonas sp. OV174]SFC48103.1 hypothetical protein SAMN05216344_1193 [Polaromonas sp. OV174]
MTSKLFTASLLTTALFAGLGMSPAMAQNNYTPAIDQTQHAISDRIQQGLASGHITPSEAQALYRRDREISMRESRYKADGQVTPQERAQLRADLDGLRADVEPLMANNVVVRPGYGGPADGIDKQQLSISQRIDAGVRSGRLNPREARELQGRERMIARHEAGYKSDGVLSPQERRQLNQELSVLRDEVERMMRNGRHGRG